MSFEVFAPGCRAQRRFLRDGAADAMRRAVHQMKDQSQRREQLVEFRQVLPDERLIVVWYSRLVHILGPFDEDGLRLIAETEVRGGRAPPQARGSKSASFSKTAKAASLAALSGARSRHSQRRGSG